MRNFNLDCGICSNGAFEPVCSVGGVEYYNPCWAVCDNANIQCSHKCPCSKQTTKNRKASPADDYEIKGNKKGNLPEFHVVVVYRASILGVGLREFRLRAVLFVTKH